MRGDAPDPAMTAAELGTYLAEVAPSLEPPHHHPGPMVSVREAEHKGHTIKITTTYEIEIDGQPLPGHVGVNNAGNVHYHSLPNYTFKSAIDLCKQVIDVFPDAFGPGHDHDDHPDHDHGGHDHGGEG